MCTFRIMKVLTSAENVKFFNGFLSSMSGKLPPASQDPTLLPSCNSPIYCYGDLLETVQMHRIFRDSKTFVDMSLRGTVHQTLANFNILMGNTSNQPTKAQVEQYVNDNFVAGNELIDWVLPDFNPHPAFLNSIASPSMKAFATKLVSIWAKLAKKIKPDVAKNPDHYSLIAVPNGFVVPGGRFKEFYYWDSYFILEGLLISEMTVTSRGMLDNFLSMVKTYGFVPNGGRKYYLNRSQPPVLTLMAKLYMKYTNDKKWLKDNILLLEKELFYWLNNKSVTVKKDDMEHTMFRYNALSLGPRPEAYFEDVQTASNISDPTLKQELYTNLKSAAESGWDFSTRWFFDPVTSNVGSKLEHIETTRVLPVDLNSMLAKSFEDLGNMFLKTGDVFNANGWLLRSMKLKLAIDKIMWNQEDGIWYDYDLDLGKQRKNFYLSNFMPLYSKVSLPKRNLCEKILTYLKTKANIPGSFPGGIPVSLLDSGEQWDLPNAFSPLQQILVEGLENLKCPEASDLARSLAMNWVQANYIGFIEDGTMYEKYDALVQGQGGSGGEYNVQEGFGWTNAVVLNFIKKYYTT